MTSGPKTRVRRRTLTSPTAPPTRTVFLTLAGALRDGQFRAAELPPGTRLDRYRVESQLGTGGMSTIYLARHLYLEQTYAVKTLRAGRADAEAAERFLREAKILVWLGHPGVVRVLDAGIADSVPYFVMEHLTGRTLDGHLGHYGALSVERAWDLLEEVARVLRRQEEVGVLHRDLKPSNLFVRHSGRFCVFDYGLSAFDAPGEDGTTILDNATRVAATWMGTPRYMAPEQFGSLECDHRVDLYALGLIAWEALVGRPARTATGVAEAMQQSQKPLPALCDERPDVPVAIEKIVRGLTAARPDERYQSAATLLEDIERHRYGGAAPRGPLRGTVFVALPYRPEFDTVFECVDALCAELALQARRMDRIVMVDNIWSRIVQEIEFARFVVADFSCAGGIAVPNPNVVTEAAHARATGRKLILISRNSALDLPFDWRHAQLIQYDPQAGGLEQLGMLLRPRFRQCVQDAPEE